MTHGQAKREAVHDAEAEISQNISSLDTQARSGKAIQVYKVALSEDRRASHLFLPSQEEKRSLEARQCRSSACSRPQASLCHRDRKQTQYFSLVQTDLR